MLMLTQIQIKTASQEVFPPALLGESRETSLTCLFLEVSVSCRKDKPSTGHQSADSFKLGTASLWEGGGEDSTLG